MRRSLLLLLPAAALLAAACSSGGTGTSAAPSNAPGAAGSSAASSAALRIDVRLLDTLRMEPATMTVPAGVPVTFVVTNAGSIDHEFYLGDTEAQAEHEMDMMSGGMTLDEPEGIALKPGQTKELTYTFAKEGETLAGCHVAGHYGGGMKAGITVSG